MLHYILPVVTASCKLQEVQNWACLLTYLITYLLTYLLTYL
jgi:hypothetical protein